MIKCPTCGSTDCIKPAAEVIECSSSMYAPCSACQYEKPLDKVTPLVELYMDLDKDEGRCPVCSKRHLDIVMAQVLDILIKNGFKDARAGLKDVGTPLIKFGVTMVEPPRLSSKDVVMVLDRVDHDMAQQIIDNVPEVKGVLKRSGRPTDSVGILDTITAPHVYELMAGCDMRADLVSSLLGDLCLYRNQGECHVEFWRNNSVKIKTMEKLFLEGMLECRTVVDGFASVGTLGLLAAMGGAKRVILNDAWLPAVRNMLINLEMNKEMLGIEVSSIADLKMLPGIGDEPVLVARATGAVEIEVYHGDFRKLDKVVSNCDVCIIDTFPGIDAEKFAGRWREITAEKVITL